MTISNESIAFVIDLDGTIIGDCTYQTILYNIENLLKKNNIKAKADKMLLESYKPSSRLIRPFFRYFIMTMKKLFPNSLFYVYTASEKGWATKEITLIEKTHGFKFNRPIFARGDCIVDSFGQYRKSIKKILPKMKKHNSLLVIDNNKTFIDYNANFLLCPTYDYVLYMSVWEKMKKEYMKIMEIHNLMTQLVANNKICKYCDHDIKATDTKLLELKHKWLYKKHKKLNSLNKLYTNDHFWKTLTNAIIDKNIKEFDKNAVDYLQTLFNVQ
jgi:hypothetical protein